MRFYLFKNTMIILLLWFVTFASFQTQKPSQPDGATVKIHNSPFIIHNYPKDYFQSPVAGDIRLSGSFGELRPNHFHAGIDIRHKEGRSGEPIFAAADGYVGRIKIQGGGYGQALYIIHPNGYTTVYGHLEKFAPAIQKFVRDKQYATQQFEQDIALDSSQFIVKKGEQIANMGNRGNSFGEHLHFEIRETVSEKTINPLLFGIRLSDNTPPNLGGFKVYEFENEEISNERSVSMKKSGNNYILSDTLEVSTEKVAFGINATDGSDGSVGRNGIFSLRVLADSQLIYKFTAEAIAFSESRFVNAHSDYEEHATTGKYFHRAFLLPGNFLSMYDSVVNRGIISVSDKPIQVNIEVGDVNGNLSRLKINLKRKTNKIVNTISKPPAQYFLPYNESSIINFNNAQLRFPVGCLYQNLNLRLGSSEIENGQLSPTYQIHNTRTPLHSDAEIAILPSVSIPDSMRSKVIMAYCKNNDAHISNLGGSFRSDGYFSVLNDDFGNYCLKYDVTPPTIRNNTSARTKKSRPTKLAFIIKDNFNGGGATALKYSATADGQFFLLEFDAKTNLLFYNLDENRVTSGEHDLVVTVTDFSGNVATYKERITF